MTQTSQYDPVTQINTVQVTGKDNAQTGKQEIVYDLRQRPIEDRQYKQDGKLYSQRTMVYDGWGRLRQSTDELKHSTQYEYDAWDRVIRTVLPDGTVVTKSYPAFSKQNLVTKIDVGTTALGTQVFDGLGRLTSSVNGGRSWTHHYPSASAVRPDQVSVPDGIERKYTYVSELDNAVKSVTAGDITQILSYDPATGAVSSSSATPGAISATMTRFASGRLKSEKRVIAGETRTAEYSYSLNGLVNTYTDVCTQQQKYSYYSTGWPKALEDTAVTVSLTYDGLQRLTGWVAKEVSAQSTSAPTLTTTLEPDEFGREIKRTISSSQGDSWVITQTWQVNHQLETRTLSFNNAMQRQETFNYDERNRLFTYVCSGTDIPANEYGKQVSQQTFSYDSLGNIKECVSTFANGSNTATYRFSTTDPCQLLKIENTHKDWPTQITLVYDDAGRLISNELGQTLAYDALGRLASVTVGGQKISEYGYDAANRLVTHKTAQGVAALYYRAQRLVNQMSTDKNQQQRFIRLGGACVAQSTNEATPQTWLTGTDGKRSVVVAMHGAQRAEYAYSAYGAQRAQAGMPDLLGYNGERLDRVNRTYHLGNGYRAYSPALMRFTCPDSFSPFGAGGLNPYSYCLGDPINGIDPSGHLSWNAWLGIGLGIVGVIVSIASLGAGAAAMAGLEVGVLSSIAATSVGAMAIEGAALVSGGLAIASGALEERNPAASKALGWASFALGLVSVGGAALGGIRMTGRAAAAAELAAVREAEVAGANGLGRAAGAGRGAAQEIEMRPIPARVDQPAPARLAQLERETGLSQRQLSAVQRRVQPRLAQSEARSSGAPPSYDLSQVRDARPAEPPPYYDLTNLPEPIGDHQPSLPPYSLEDPQNFYAIESAEGLV